MTVPRKNVALLSLALFLSLPSQAGALYVCSMSGTAQPECCCKDQGPGAAAVREPGVSCCNEWHWPAAEPSVKVAAQAVIALPVVTKVLPAPAEMRPAPSHWMPLVRLPADPDPPELYLTSRGFRS